MLYTIYSFLLKTVSNLSGAFQSLSQFSLTVSLYLKIVIITKKDFIDYKIRLVSPGLTFLFIYVQ